ncbi:MAG: redoxin domain-containing protein [Pirellulales bacterium]
MSELRGKVVIVHFYAFECVNCKRNLPIYAQWADRYKERDVAIIGIQTPETSAEADPKAVRSAATADRIQYPVLIDLERKNWKAWANTMWPTVYVIDRQGYIRFWWQGELRWQGASGDKTVQETIEALLKEGK